MKSRNMGIDLLKVFACIGVVMLHTMMDGFSQNEMWNINAYLYYLGVYSIPLFFMINGYFLLNKDKLDYRYIFDKIKIILLSVTTWSMLIWLLKKDFSLNPLKQIVASFLQRGYFFQFWFLGTLMIIYLTLPILKGYLKSERRYYTLLIPLLMIGIIFEGFNLMSNTVLQSYVIQSLRLWTWYFYYIIGGFIGYKKKINNWVALFQRNKLIYVLLFFISPIYMFLVAKYFHRNLFAEFFYDNLIIKIVAIGLFTLFLQINLTSRFQRIANLSTLIMGVFIIHTYVMKLFEGLVRLDALFGYICYFVATLSVSFIISGIIYKIPYVNRLINL